MGRNGALSGRFHSKGADPMFSINLPDYFYDLSPVSITLRLVLAVIFGGIIGLQRESRGQFAGFRTHILVCVGAALAMLTNQYICEFFTGTHDPARLGAQVITGVGFLGVGTILITGGHKIKGLTTAAGLWASACLGLAVGIGFYFGALVAAVIIFISLMPKLEAAVMARSRRTEFYAELDSIPSMKALSSFMESKGIRILERSTSSAPPVFSDSVALLITAICPSGEDRIKLIEQMNELEYVRLVEEI